MEITVNGTPKEIAELVLEIQARQQCKSKKPFAFTVDGKEFISRVEEAQRQASRIVDTPDCLCKPGSR